MDAVNPLNYAPRPSAATRVSRWIYRFILIGGVAAVFVFWGPGLWRWANFLLSQHQCMIYWQPPTHMVLETNNYNIVYSELCPPLNAMQRYLDDPTPDDGTIYLHEMQTPSGSKRLVLLSLSSGLHGGGNLSDGRIQFGLTQWTASASPRLLTCGNIEVTQIEDPFTSTHHWKFFAAQPDLGDPSHFTFNYDVDNAHHTCDAWLKDDGQLIISPGS